MSGELRRIEPRRQRRRPLPGRSRRQRSADRQPGFLDQCQRHLPSADQLEIDVGEDFGIEQRAMQRPPRIVDAIVLAQRIEIDAGAGVLFAGEDDGVDHRVGEAAAAGLFEFDIEELHVETGIVGDERRLAEKAQHLVGDLGEARLVGEERIGEAMDAKRLLGHLPLGIEVAMEILAGRDVVDEFDAADLDDTIAGQRIEAGGFGVEDDFSGHLMPCGLAFRASTSARTAARVWVSGRSV